MKLPYGVKNGKLVHVSKVEKGLNCGAVCPSCKHPLVARKGDKTSHHFAHYKGKDCEYGLETALHLAAKEILEKYKKIVIPETYVEILNKDLPDWRISKEVQLELKDVKLETYKEGIIPDILAFVQGKPLMIEITVTHKTGEEKIEKVRKQGISILEISLEDFEADFSIDDLEKAIIFETSNKKWLLNMKAEHLKNAAYLASERKIFKGEKRPFCPTGSKYKGWHKFSWSYDCATCEFCLDIKHDTIGTTSTENKTTVFCLGKNKINSLNDLNEFIKIYKI